MYPLVNARRVVLGCAILAPSLLCAQAQQTQQNQQGSQTQQPQKTQQVTNCRALDTAGGFIASDEVLMDGMVCKLAKPKKVVFVPEVPQGTSGNLTSVPNAKTIDVSATDAGSVQPTGQGGSLADVARSYGKTSKILVAPKGKTESPVVRPGASMAEIARAYRGESAPTAAAVPAPEPAKAEVATEVVPTQNMSVADVARAYGKVSQVLVAPRNGNPESEQALTPQLRPGASVAEIARAYKKSTQPQLITSKGSAASRLLTKPEREAEAAIAAPKESREAVAVVQPATTADAVIAKESPAPRKEVAAEVSSAPVMKVEQPAVATRLAPSEPSLPKLEVPTPANTTVASAPGVAKQPAGVSVSNVAPEPVRASQPVAKPELKGEPVIPAPVVAKSVPQPAVSAPEPVQVVEAPAKPVLNTDFAKPEAKTARSVKANAPSIGIVGQSASVGISSSAISAATRSPEAPPAEVSAAESPANSSVEKADALPEVVLSSAPAEPAKESGAEAPAAAAAQVEAAPEPARVAVAKTPGEVKSSGFDAVQTATIEAKPEAAEPTPAASMAPSEPPPTAQPAVNAGTFSQPDASASASDKATVQEAMPVTVEDTATARPEVQTGSFGVPEVPVVEPKPEKPIDPFEQGQSLDDLSGDAPHPGCSKIVSLGSLEKDRLMLTIPTWALQWAIKNQKKFPGICFADAPVQGLRSFLVVFFTTPMPVAGVNAPTVPGALDSVLQKPSGGTFSTTFGSTWHYTEDNAATTTVTTALQESMPRNWGKDTQFAIAYSEQGTAVSQHYPAPLKKKELEILTAKPGGKHDPSAIEARRLGDLLTAILQDIANH
jgi:hypothetical protein